MIITAPIQRLLACLQPVIHKYAPESIQVNAQQANNVDPSSRNLRVLIPALEQSKRYR